MTGRPHARVAIVMAAVVGLEASGQAMQASPATPAPYVDAIPPPRDVPYPGSITIHVDATDTARGIYRVTEDMPMSPGPRTLFYAAWQPGAHSIQGNPKEVAGLRISAGGKAIEWRRDPVNLYAFHFVVPKGVTSIHVAFEYLSPATRAQGMIQVYPGVSWLEWSRLVLYPAGTYTRRIPIDAEALVPKGYHVSSGLDPASREGDLVRFPRTDIDTLFDSPALAGAFVHTQRLTDRVSLVRMSGSNDFPIHPKVVAGLRNLAVEARALFGVEHFKQYRFIAAENDDLGPYLEHRTSSQHRYTSGFFAKPIPAWQADIYPHEFVHSWNGKFMRPNDLWTANYQLPMRGSQLWVYEGLTHLWGLTLATRSGIMSKQDALETFAIIAAREQYQPGRNWKSLLDSTLDNANPIRRTLSWPSYQREQDFYLEGALLWLEVDSILRSQSSGKRSLDDFAKAFFGGGDGDPGEHSYDRDDVIRVLQTVAPHDWARFFRERVDQTAPVPMGGITNSGYRLVYDSVPNSYSGSWIDPDISNLFYSVGFSISSKGDVSDVIWDGPGFKAGLRPGSRITAVNGKPYAKGLLESAIETAKASGMIALNVAVFDKPHSIVLQWAGGLRYPHLVKDAGPDGALDRILRPAAKP